QLERAQFDWSPTGDGPFEVRLTVEDHAKNVGTATIQVRPDPSRPAVPPSGAAAPGDRKVVYVNKKTFKLTYKIDGVGPSRVKHVQVWMTRDTNQWNLYPKEAPHEGPFEITVNGQGRYGYTLCPISGVGRGPAAPRAGDQPQVWIEVDETPPVVQL